MSTSLTFKIKLLWQEVNESITFSVEDQTFRKFARNASALHLVIARAGGRNIRCGSSAANVPSSAPAIAEVWCQFSVESEDILTSIIRAIESTNIWRLEVAQPVELDPASASDPTSVYLERIRNNTPIAILRRDLPTTLMQKAEMLDTVSFVWRPREAALVAQEAKKMGLAVRGGDVVFLPQERNSSTSGDVVSGRRRRLQVSFLDGRVRFLSWQVGEREEGEPWDEYCYRTGEFAMRQIEALIGMRGDIQPAQWEALRVRMHFDTEVTYEPSDEPEESING